MRKTNFCTIALFAVASIAYAKAPKVYQAGEISQVNQVPCSATRNQQSQPLCREYTLQSDNVMYTIRPRHQKHELSISIGDREQFRLNKDIIVMRSEDVNSKEHPFVVISVSPASDSSTADVRPVRINHLQ